MDILSLFNESTIIESNGVELDLTKVAPAGIKYLIEYGFAKSLQDKVAGMKKDGKSDAEILAARVDRANAILGGTIGHGTSGPRLIGRDRMVHLVAVEHLTAFAAKKSAKMPDGKGAAEKLRAMVVKWMANPDRAAAVNAEADRRMATQEAVDGADTADLDDLLSAE